MRWEVVSELLTEYDITTRTKYSLGVDNLRVAEVGVFAGEFSEGLLKKFPKLELIGVDPYIGYEFRIKNKVR